MQEAVNNKERLRKIKKLMKYSVALPREMFNEINNRPQPESKFKIKIVTYSDIKSNFVKTSKRRNVITGFSLINNIREEQGNIIFYKTIILYSNFLIIYILIII
jgi:hypothetical protein